MTNREALERILTKGDDAEARDDLLDDRAAQKWRELSRNGRLPDDPLAALLRVFSDSASRDGRTVPNVILAKAAARLEQDAKRLAQIVELGEQVVAKGRRA